MSNEVDFVIRLCEKSFVVQKGVKSNMNKIKRFLKKNFLTKRLYAFLYSQKRRKELDHTREAIQTKGIETIEAIQNIMEPLGIPFFFDMGTLLGIVREGRLLGHDLDIDSAVIPNSKDDIQRITEWLIQQGCVHKYRYEVEGVGVVEDSFTMNGIKFDVNYYYRNEECDVCYLGYRAPEKNYEEGTMNAVRLSCPRIEKITNIHFGDCDVNIPSNPEQYLANRYGDNWRVPDKGYIYWKGPSATPIENICKQTIYE